MLRNGTLIFKWCMNMYNKAGERCALVIKMREYISILYFIFINIVRGMFNYSYSKGNLLK